MMTSAKWIGAVLATFVSLGSAHAQDLSPVATEELISKLQDVSAQDIGAHQTGEAHVFMAVDDKPSISPAMRELVRRGLPALPMLIDHLSDARPTKLDAGNAMSKHFGKEYDARDRDPAKKHRIPR